MSTENDTDAPQTVTVELTQDELEAIIRHLPLEIQSYAHIAQMLGAALATFPNPNRLADEAAADRAALELAERAAGRGEL